MQAFNTTLFLDVFLFYASEVRLHPNFNNIHGFDYYLIFSGKNVTDPPATPPVRRCPLTPMIKVQSWREGLNCHV